MSSAKTVVKKKIVRCAIYTRVSTDRGLDQEFNSLDAQREASEAYIKSQAHEGWVCLKDQYDDGGFSGGGMERPALQKLLEDVRHQKLDVIVVYKVDRLTRSLADFAKLVELFDAHEVSFVSVTQSFNTTSSMGRLTLNVLLSFAQFEREVTGERIRDKIAASKKKGLWMGGVVPHGYRVEDRKLVVEPSEAADIRMVMAAVLEHLGPSECTAPDERSAMKDAILRAEVRSASVMLTFKPTEGSAAEAPPKIITIPWAKPPSTRKRDILGHQPQTSSRPIRTEARTRLLKGIAQGRRWLDQLLNGRAADIGALATQHQISEKTVRSMISLAFLAPDIVQAAIDGKLPRGLGISQMTDPSADWSEQRHRLGIV